MSGFGSWIMSVVGAILLTTLIDLCLQDGETKKFVKIVCSLIIFAIILAPITTAFSSDKDLLTILENDMENATANEYAVKEQAFLAQLKEKEYETLKNKAVSSMKKKGIDGVEILVISDTANGGEILKIIVNTQNAVINSEYENIDFLKEIKDEVTFYFNIEDSLVEILSNG